jgi:hypothetical protein
MEQDIGRRAIKGVGGTRNCDWWFTDEAVLLDTAGRYTTQDSDRIADGAGWGQFLQLLKRHRRRRPINGVLVAYSASDLLTRSETDFNADMTALRSRIAELNRHLGISLPVYLLVTKADLVSGFREYFDDLDATGRRQVWGTTFALDDSRSGRALRTLPAEFRRAARALEPGRQQAAARGARPAATRGIVRVSATVRRAEATVARADRRRVRVRGAGQPDVPARCLFHERHAGRYADRPAAWQPRALARTREAMIADSPARRVAPISSSSCCAM